MFQNFHQEILQATKSFYVNILNFHQVGGTYDDYLMLRRDDIELHFFLHCELDVSQNYGMCYIRISGIENFYKELKNKSSQGIEIGELEARPWRQKEFSITDNDHNQLTFGESI